MKSRRLCRVNNGDKHDEDDDDSDDDDYDDDHINSGFRCDFRETS
jgi:hypothetical protein